MGFYLFSPNQAILDTKSSRGCIFFRAPSISRKLNIACIGCGGKGRTDILGVSTESIVGLCDVDPAQAGEIFTQYPDVPKFQDYRNIAACVFRIGISTERAGFLAARLDRPRKRVLNGGVSENLN